MKKTILLLLIIFCTTHYTSFAQEAFKKNDIIFTGGLGLGAGLSFQINSPYDDYDKSSVSATKGSLSHLVYNLQFPLTAEYAIHNKWGLGLSFAHNSYFLSYYLKGQGNDIGIFGALHFLRKKRIELYTRLTVGLSNMKASETIPLNYNNKDVNLHYTMTGFFLKPSFGFRYYFNNHVGFFADGGIKVFMLTTDKYESSYDGMHSLNPKSIMTNINLEISTGLAVKF